MLRSSTFICPVTRTKPWSLNEWWDHVRGKNSLSADFLDERVYCVLMNCVVVTWECIITAVRSEHGRAMLIDDGICGKRVILSVIQDTDGAVIRINCWSHRVAHTELYVFSLDFFPVLRIRGIKWTICMYHFLLNNKAVCVLCHHVTRAHVTIVQNTAWARACFTVSYFIASISSNSKALNCPRQYSNSLLV